MSKRISGRYERTSVAGEEVAAFVPFALPPADPPISISGALTDRLRAAEQALVRLEWAGEMAPSLDWFIYAFVRKEAVVTLVMKLLETTKPTAGRAVELLVASGVLVETTGKKRDRSFAYKAYLDRLRVGTELTDRGRRF